MVIGYVRKVFENNNSLIFINLFIYLCIYLFVISKSLILLLNSESSPSSPLTHPYLLPITHCPIILEGDAPQGCQQNFHITWGRTRTFPLYQVWTRYPSLWNWLQTGSSSTKDKHCILYWRSHTLPMSDNCHLHSERLRCSILVRFPNLGLESVSSHLLCCT